MRGRRTQPAAVKEAKGNPGRRPIVREGGPSALTDDALAAAAPSWLGEQGRKVWDRLAPDLTRMRLLSRPDAYSFGRYCEWFAHWMTANEALQGGGLVVRTTSEHVEMDRLNKHLQAALLIEKRLVDMEDRFGLNPALRQRIFAQRAAGGGQRAPGDLFGDQSKGDEPSKPAEKPAAGPLGFLN